MLSLAFLILVGNLCLAILPISGNAMRASLVVALFLCLNLSSAEQEISDDIDIWLNATIRMRFLPSSIHENSVFKIHPGRNIVSNVTMEPRFCDSTHVGHDLIFSPCEGRLLLYTFHRKVVSEFLNVYTIFMTPIITIPATDDMLAFLQSCIYRKTCNRAVCTASQTVPDANRCSVYSSISEAVTNRSHVTVHFCYAGETVSEIAVTAHKMKRAPTTFSLSGNDMYMLPHLFSKHYATVVAAIN